VKFEVFQLNSDYVLVQKTTIYIEYSTIHIEFEIIRTLFNVTLSRI